MTKEEAIKILKENYDYHVNYDGGDYNEWGDDLAEAVKIATQTLEQEPCEDAISRQAVLDLMADYDLSMGQVVRGIHALPSVNPQESKMGNWIPLGNYDDYGNESSYKCSECGDIDTYPDNYCHNCGAKMVEPQESEG